jgi:CheY-like chemotaxis protein
MEDNTDLLKISEVAKKANVAPSTIRYYTDMGLITVAGYTPGGQRLYSEKDTVKKVRQVEWLSQKGKTINEIKQILSEITIKKVLIVDDDKEICELIHDVIKEKLDKGYDVRFAYDGFSAGKILSDFVPDLILLDIYLPGINGIEICKQIRQDKYLRETKILAMTGYDSPEQKAEIINSGADDYLAKPMDINVLHDKIKLLLGV